MNYLQESVPEQPVETSSAFLRTRQRLPTRWFTLAGMIGPIIFVSVFTIAGFMRPGYSAIYQVISDLGSGPNAWLLNSDLVIFGFLLIIFAIGFFYEMRLIISKRCLQISTTFLILPGIGIASDAFFADDVFKSYPTTLHGILHAGGFILAFASFITALIIIGYQLKNSSQWQRYAHYSIITALLILVFGIGLRLLRIVGILTAATGGLTERFLLMIALSWYVVIGYKIFIKGNLYEKDKEQANVTKHSSSMSKESRR